MLFVHGIVGTPRHFDFLIDVVPSTVSIYNILLDGHGYGVRDFSRTFVYQSYADEVVSRKTFKMVEDIPCAELARVLGIALGETINVTKSTFDSQL